MCKWKFDKAECNKLARAFPKMFINYNFEVIIHPKTNVYFRLEDVESQLQLKCKVIEFVSRMASKGLDAKAKKYCRDGLCRYFNYQFTDDELSLIYTKIGGGVNREKTIKFISALETNNAIDKAILQMKRRKL